MYVVVTGEAGGPGTLVFLGDDGRGFRQPETFAADDFAAAVRRVEGDGVSDGSPLRWVWVDTAPRVATLLDAGVRVDRCHDLRLAGAILRASTMSANSALAEAPATAWGSAAPVEPVTAAARAGGLTLFDDDLGSSAPQAGFRDARRDAPGSSTGDPGDDRRLSGEGQGDRRLSALELGRLHRNRATPALSELRSLRARPAQRAVSKPAPEHADEPPVVTEFCAQLDAIAGSSDPARLRLLVAAESAGALIAAEMTHAGLPWREDLHDELLTELLGPRPAAGQRPEGLERRIAGIRRALDAPGLNPDSPVELIRALRGAGLTVETTRSWELRQLQHPAIAPLLEYKKLSRLYSANGWSWMESWVRGGRFHADYVPGGVVTGRWATKGGGALQLPKQIRRAVTADEGWMLVVADAAQLEPRILAAISGDQAMAAAGRGKDLYEGIVASGAVKTRAEAKVAMLGAMYGATTGESARLMPRLTRAFPTAIGFVESAARAGERGEIVTSLLGRSSPRPGEAWLELQARVTEGAASGAEQQRFRQISRDWGRFTRNFVVQASAAEWALCWMADLRQRLGSLAGAPQLVFFLHDEIIVHAPRASVDAAADAVRAAAVSATQLLFRGFPVDVPLDVSVVSSYADAS